MGGEKKEPLHKSFGYAWEGITAVIKKGAEHEDPLLCDDPCHFGGAIFRIAAWKWCICFCLFGLVMSLEIVNTAVEAVVDLVTEERKPLAKLAKDAAAGAVLLAAIMAVIAGLILFLPEGLEFLCMVLK